MSETPDIKIITGKGSYISALEKEEQGDQRAETRTLVSNTIFIGYSPFLEASISASISSLDIKPWEAALLRILLKAIIAFA